MNIISETSLIPLGLMVTILVAFVSGAWKLSRVLTGIESAITGINKTLNGNGKKGVCEIQEEQGQAIENLDKQVARIEVRLENK